MSANGEDRPTGAEGRDAGAAFPAESDDGVLPEIELPQVIPDYFLDPEAYIDTDEAWAEFDLERWTEEVYTYERDDWNGLKNVAQDPVETVRSGTGDCEDYALVALSWLHARGVDEAGMAVYYHGEDAFGHALAYGPDRLYSSGAIYEGTPESYHERSSYSLLFTNDL